jgi:predicted secreted hydrolase
MNRRLFLIAPVVIIGNPAFALDYPQVVQGKRMQFPQDHGAHPKYRTEWWYVTGWVKDETGEESGIQITFFRNRPGVQEDNPVLLAPKQLLFGQVAVANARHGMLLHAQRAARALSSVASASEQGMDLQMQDWRLLHEGSRFVSFGQAKDFKWRLTFEPTQALMPQGDAGVSRKGPLKVQSSYYYSLPQLKTKGTLTILGEEKKVTGIAWLDHEWFSEPLPVGTVGWDWTGINFDDGRALMAFRIRDAFGRARWAGGAVRSPDGHLRVLTQNEVNFAPGRRWRSPRTLAEYPVEWHIKLPGLELSLVPLMDDQELDGRGSHGAIYWEGAVRAIEAGRVSGRGYVELTGYAAPVKF